ncbi:GspH/FimT family pseudopilin [Collimonas sp.]|jgi:type IV fimbrial biogenesis protein FimT|uniref:GspH/FimT family pseudopilin n=1 Tax=Collimonas sp. TaxID=1963772 RepID=UPI002BEC19C5|nr:GspH/FimT family pseudopilin [Collimonas sp.]HWX04169.1 GspH/FimT family pseudopilin [Collimonas sp.]
MTVRTDLKSICFPRSTEPVTGCFQEARPARAFTQHGSNSCWPILHYRQCGRGFFFARFTAVSSQQLGFTLIELLITIVIAAILMALAMPSFSSMLMNNRLSAQANAFVNALNYARSNALTQNVNAQVCPLGAAGSVTCGTNWGAGWIVITLPATGTSVLLQSHQVGPRDPVLSAVAFNGATASGITFDPRGLATTQSNFKICDSRGASYARSLQVIATGSVQQGPTPGQAIWGGALVCP